MPRKSQGARLYLRSRRDRPSAWVILDDGGVEVGTGCGATEFEQAQAALATYHVAKYQPRKAQDSLDQNSIADVVKVYLDEKAPGLADGGLWVGWMLAPILMWWDNKTLADISGKTCGAYVAHRVAEGVQTGTPRHELTILKAAIRYFGANHGPLPAMPIVTLPPKPQGREEYWLTRKEVADRIRAARRLHRCEHVIRVLLTGVYSGTRSGAMFKLSWMPSTAGGWIDFASETMHRRGLGKTETKKRQPPVRIHQRLLPHLRRWHKADSAAGIRMVCHYFGKQVKSIDNAWEAVAIEAGHFVEVEQNGKLVKKALDAPHICRHTAATWQMQSGVDLYEAAGFLGMSPETLWSTYGHHSPHFQQRASSASGRRPKNAQETHERKRN